MDTMVLEAIVTLLGSSPVILTLIWRMTVQDKRYDAILSRLVDISEDA